MPKRRRGCGGFGLVYFFVVVLLGVFCILCSQISTAVVSTGQGSSRQQAPASRVLRIAQQSSSSSSGGCNAGCDVDVLVVGGGPTGLGVATRLHQLGHDNWLLVDAAESAGGLACTDVTPEGFLFDMGGHVIFSHLQYFDDLLNTAVGGRGEEQWAVHERVSYVWIRGRYVAYPFQNNLNALPKDDQVRCLAGLAAAQKDAAIAQDKPRTFDEWIMRSLGEGIANLFARPYNFKVWATPTTEMNPKWVGERVATVNLTRALSNVIFDKEDAGWGPNALFRFPQDGGNGGPWIKVAEMLPSKRLRFGADNSLVGLELRPPAAEVSSAGGGGGAYNVATFADGSTVRFNRMVSTMPLDETLRMVGKSEWADDLFYSSSNIIGIGIRGDPDRHGKKCWLYYPESDSPFYRATVFSSYADANTPAASVKLPTLRRADGTTPPGAGASVASEGPYWSLMFEVSESPHKPVDHTVDAVSGWSAVVEDTIRGALNVELMRPEDEIVSIYHRRLEHGYPTPSIKRDGVLEKALPWLKERGVWSRGRFGSWKYEVGNQDHSLMLGVEAADNILFGSTELALNYPDLANSEYNTDLQYSRRTDDHG